MAPRMLFDDSFIAALRTGKDLPGEWGLYSKRDDRWLDVVFATEREANAAIEILRMRPSQDVSVPVAPRRRGYH